MRFLKENLNLNEIDKKNFSKKIKLKKLNLIDINFDQNKAFQKFHQIQITILKNHLKLD